MKNHTCGTFARVLMTSIFTLSLTTGCLEKAAEETSKDGNGSTNKATLSSWGSDPTSSPWAIRLDLPGANIEGTPFSLTIKFADSSEVRCTATLNGTEASGSYTISSCGTTTPGSGSMSDKTGGSVFETGGAGTYVSNGSTFYWCRNNKACFTYY